MFEPRLKFKKQRRMQEWKKFKHKIRNYYLNKSFAIFLRWSENSYRNFIFSKTTKSVLLFLLYSVQCTVHNRNLYINLTCLSVLVFVCLFVSNERQNGWIDRAQIFCGTSRDHREGLWMIKIKKMCFKGF